MLVPSLEFGHADFSFCDHVTEICWFMLAYAYACWLWN